jgi:RNA polymerase sporulation-specific sigma factor
LQDRTNEELVQLARDGNEEALNCLIKKNIGLAHNVANEFSYTGYDHDDLVQCANIGIFKAYKYFDQNKGVKFSNFAAKWMKYEIYRFLEQNKKNERLKEVSLNKILYEGEKKNGDMSLENMIVEEESDVSFEDRMFLSEVLRKVKEMVKKRDWEIFTQYYFHNKKQKDLSKIYNLSTQSIYNAVNRVKLKMMVAARELS